MDTPTKSRVTAVDFFLWLGAMVALYVSATSLILLIHQYINALFPDALAYGDPYSGAIRFSIASLIVIFPLYIYLTRVVHQMIRRNPEKKDLWVRKWLIFLTLFVAGATMAIDLVMLINNFLSGDLTVRFALKALSILVVIGSGFWYYLSELKGRWETKEQQSKMIGAGVAVIVLASVIGGFFIIGSPFSERQYRFDDTRVGDLTNIQYQVLSYWQSKEKFPATISDLNDPLSGVTVPVDPETGAAYEYRATGALTFELCATFSKPSRNQSGAMTRPAYPGSDDNWQHDAGHQCFTRTIDPDRYPPVKNITN